MTDGDRKSFAEAMHLLFETFGEPVSDLRTEGYFDALREFDIVAVNGAVRMALRASRFCPKPVELRELITGNAQDAAETAWGGVLREIRRVGYVGTPNLDPRTLRAVNETWGGWRRLCETLPGEGPELIGWMKQFKATYASCERETDRQLTAASMHPNVKAFIATKQRGLPDPKRGALK
jgi:hypothetical protein